MSGIARILKKNILLAEDLLTCIYLKIFY